MTRLLIFRGSEWYPVEDLVPEDDERYDDVVEFEKASDGKIYGGGAVWVEVDEETAARWRQAFADFDAVQDEIEEALE